MIDGLVSGKLFGTATRKTGRSGKPFTTAKVRAAAGDGEGLFVNVVAFSESAQAALLALDDGEAVSLAGTLKPTTWTDREGQPRAGLDMVAAAVLTAYHVTKKRRTVAGEDTAKTAQRPRHDAWEARSPGPTQRQLHPDLDDGAPLDF